MTSQTRSEPVPAETRQSHPHPTGSAASGEENPFDQIKPWRGKATRTDKALLGTMLGVFLVLLAMWPLRPFLIADHPVSLAFVTGSKASIGAAAAYARVGEIPLWLAIAAGTVGMVKTNWLFWWTGRRWGRGMIDLFAKGDGAQRVVDRLQNTNRGLVGIAIVLSYLPGIPRVLVYGVAGWTGMGLVTFLVLDTLGALALTTVVAGCGYALGQGAVDLIIAIDDKALWASLAIALALPFVPKVKALLRGDGTRDRAPRQETAGTTTSA